MKRELSDKLIGVAYLSHRPSQTPVGVIVDFENPGENSSTRQLLPNFDLTFISPEQVVREQLRDNFAGILVYPSLGKLHQYRQQLEVLRGLYLSLKPNSHLALAEIVYPTPTPPSLPNSHYWLELMHQAGFENAWLLEQPRKEKGIAIFTGYKLPYPN